VSDAAIDDAVRILRAGGLVAFPTETVYGLGADAANARALERLYAVKGRPREHPVIVHIARAAQLDDLGRDVPPIARRLAREFWPGPLTLIVRRDRTRVSEMATGGRDTVGLRVPDHPLAIELLDAFGRGIAAPSANRFGRVSPTTAAHVVADLGSDVDLVLDGGPCAVGVESTIVDVSGAQPVVLRIGGVSDEQLADVTGARLGHRTAGEIAAPGTLVSHYAPAARVEIVDAPVLARRARELAASRVAVLALDPPDDLPGDVTVLDPPSDVDEYARVLYSRLREADRLQADVVLAVLPPAVGIGAAVCDRLRRAAAG
jgi:L-threonylcarbamoyladenylate synthase